MPRNLDRTLDGVIAVSAGRLRIGSLIRRGRRVDCYDADDVWIGEVPASRMIDASRLVVGAWKERQQEERA
jgi:hypothetical protein